MRLVIRQSDKLFRHLTDAFRPFTCQWLPCLAHWGTRDRIKGLLAIVSSGIHLTNNQATLSLYAKFKMSKVTHSPLGLSAYTLTRRFPACPLHFWLLCLVCRSATRPVNRLFFCPALTQPANLCSMYLTALSLASMQISALSTSSRVRTSTPSTSRL